MEATQRHIEGLTRALEARQTEVEDLRREVQALRGGGELEIKPEQGRGRAAAAAAAIAGLGERITSETTIGGEHTNPADPEEAAAGSSQVRDLEARLRKAEASVEAGNEVLVLLQRELSRADERWAEAWEEGREAGRLERLSSSSSSSQLEPQLQPLTPC